MSYARSERLNYTRMQDGERWIHRLAVKWWNALDQQIQRECRRPPAQYVLVRSDLQPISGAAGEHDDVVTSGRYEQLRENGRRIAVISQRCRNSSSAGDTRARPVDPKEPQAVAAGELLGTDCGVEMAAIERVLAQEHYTVHSWREFAGVDAALDLARKHGVELLLQINSLGTAPARNGAERQNQWFASNAEGEQLAPLSGPGAARVLSADDVEQLNALVAQMEPGPMRLDTQTDLTMIDVATGETVWLYRSQHLYGEDTAARGSARLFVGEPQKFGQTTHGRVWRATPARARPGSRVLMPAPELDTGWASGGDAFTRGLGRDHILQEAVKTAIRCFSTNACGQFTGRYRATTGEV